MISSIPCCRHYKKQLMIRFIELIMIDPGSFWCILGVVWFFFPSPSPCLLLKSTNFSIPYLKAAFPTKVSLTTSPRHLYHYQGTYDNCDRNCIQALFVCPCFLKKKKKPNRQTNKQNLVYPWAFSVGALYLLALRRVPSME